MPSRHSRRSLLAGAAAVTLAGCSTTGDGDSDSDDAGRRLSLDPTETDTPGRGDSVALFGESVSAAFRRLAERVVALGEPQTVRDRIEIAGFDGETAEPPFDAFEIVDIRDTDGNLETTVALSVETVPPYRLPHVATPIEETPAEAAVVDLAEQPPAVAETLTEVLESDERVRLDGWSPAVETLDEHAQGGGVGELTAYVRHDGNHYRVDRLAITPTPFPGDAVVVTASVADADPETTFVLPDLSAAARGIVETELEAGYDAELPGELLAFAEEYDYLLTDGGAYTLGVT